MKNYIKLLLGLTILATGQISLAMADFEIPPWVEGMAEAAGRLGRDIVRDAENMDLTEEQKADLKEFGLGLGKQAAGIYMDVAGGVAGAAKEAIRGNILKGQRREEAKLRRKEMQEETKIKGEQFRQNMTHFAQTFLDDKKRLSQLGIAIVGTAAGIYFFKNMLPIIRKMIEERLSTPPLIDETSIGYMKWWPFVENKGQDAPKLSELYFDKKLQDRIDQIISSYKRISAKGGFFLNYLFYGEPGTGKTASARALALESGMDYAIMSGGNVQKLLKTGKAEQRLKEVFNWANQSKKGLILFIDEADAFLKDPNAGEMTEELYAVLNSFLNLTGTENKKISLILSTNHPQRLPKAVIDRVGPGQFVYFGRPEYEQRVKIVTQLLPKYFGKNKKLFTPELIDMIAQKTQGFSGRNISYLMLSLSQNDIFEGDKVNYEAIYKLVNDAVEQSKQSTTFHTHA